MIQLLGNSIFRHPNNTTNLNLQLKINLFQFKQLQIQKTPQLDSFIKFSISPTMICRIIQSLPNSVYHTIFILNHNRISYTILRHIHPQSNKNTITVAKSPPKCLDNQSKQRFSIHLQVKANYLNKPPQQSSRNTEATKVNAIMEKLDNSDGNRHRSNTNINHFIPLFESDNEEGTKPRTKPKNTPGILLSEYKEEE